MIMFYILREKNTKIQQILLELQLTIISTIFTMSYFSIEKIVNDNRELVMHIEHISSRKLRLI